MKKKSKKKFSESGNPKPLPKKLNPFEVHINRKKYDVLGMKSKAERGLPGVSRTKSLKKRKVTLLQEYKYKDKKNVFFDRRIGERNSAMTAEDKILARYTTERMKFHSKKSIYNLGEDEELTHKGQTLTEIEKFDDPKSDDDDDNPEENGKLDSDFVGDAHFGGGIFKKVDGESKSRKDLIDHLIAESIKRKAEKQKLRQQTIDLTEKLDSEWKELLPLVTASKKSKSDVEPENKKDDKFADYDILSKKLKFEARGQATDRLKSEEEIAKEEKDKLEELEKDRIQRMLGESRSKTIKHRSADDMDDGFDLSNEPKVLTYKDGVLNFEEKIEKSNSDDDSPQTEEVTENESDEDEQIEVSGNEDENNDEEKNENSEGDESEDDLSDLKDTDDENDLETEDPGTDKQQNKIAEVAVAFDKDLEKESVKKAKAMETARKELPYTFKIPKDYEGFEKLMHNYDSEFQSVIVERMIKCHHPSLKEEFKEDLELLYTFLLQHLQDCATEHSSKLNCFKTLDRLAPWLYDLTQWNPESCASGLLEVLEEKYSDFLKNSKSYPSLDTLIFLKLVSILFPTSDYRHPVVTPALIFMQQMLFQCKVQSSVDVSIGLFVASLVLEYCSLSKRFVPEAISFLSGILRLVHPKNSKLPVILPFKFETEDSFNLNFNEKSRISEINKMSTHNLVYKCTSEEFKTNAISLALKLLSKFCDFWSGEPSAILIFEPFVSLLDVNVFNECLKPSVEEVLNKVLSFKKEGLTMLVLERKKPKPLRLYEPNIEEVYCLKKYRPMGKKKAERAKLMHKYKREMKGALREIRKDRSFLAKLKFKETVKSDLERKRKVREILGAAAEQAGELRKIKKKKK